MKKLRSISLLITVCLLIPFALTGCNDTSYGKCPAKQPGTQWQSEDGRIFIDSVSWRQLAKRGFRVSVLKNITIAAVTVNPYSPKGYSFEHEALRDAMQEALPEIPVIDVRL